MTPLQKKLEERDLAGVREILTEDPVRIDDRTDDGVPLALYAARFGDLAIVRYIVEYSRASMNTVDGQNRTILHYAAMSGSVELNRYLVEKVGMDLTAGDAQRVTPYQIAWERGHRELLAYYQERVGAAYEEMYHNPIRTGMFPDPSIVRVGEDYYMVNSSFIFFPCIPISHSRDLIHWEIIGHAIEDPAWAALDELEGGRGYWAPDISYDDGTFYITATYRLNDTGTVYRKQIVVSSQRPEGPYGKPAVIDEDGIDPSIFHEDGRHYMLLNRGARIFELSSDCTRQISPARLLYYGDQKRAPEGPHLLKKDGWYYLFLAEGGTGLGHRITVARSRTLMGNYEPCPYNPILRQNDERGAIQRCGHGKPVCTQNGEWYMVYLCGRRIGDGYSMLGRETAIDPVTWTADGWPVVNGLKGPSVLQRRPNLPEYAPDQAETVRHLWVSPRPPEPDGIRQEGDRFYLKGSRAPLERVDARNLLLRRQTAFCFAAEVTLALPALRPGQEAGLVCYYDENTWVSSYVGCEETGELFVQVREHIGAEDVYHAKTPLAAAGDVSELRFSVETADLARTFAVRAGEQCVRTPLANVYYLCDEGIRMGKRFTGAMVGMYAYAGGEPFTAEFRSFAYEDRETVNG